MSQTSGQRAVYRIAAYVLALTTALSLVGCRGGSGGDSNVVKIGLIAAFNGPLAYFGAAFGKGTAMYADEIQEAGGIFEGKTLEVISCDSERRADKEVTCVEKLVNKDKVTAIIADSSEGIRSPRAMKTINDNKIPVMLPTQVLPEDEMTGDKSPYLFGDSTRKDVASTLIEFMQKQQGHTKFALLHATDFYGDEGMKETTEAFKAAGIQPTTVETYAVGDQDMTIQAGKIRDSGAQAVIIWGLGSDAARAVESMKRIGYKPQVAGPPGLYINTYRQVLQADSNDTIMAAPHAKGDLPVNLQEIAWIFRFYLKYGFNFFTINGKSAPDWPVVEMNAYKSIRYIGQAIDKVQTTDGEAIRNILESGQRFESLGNQVRWTQQNHLSKTQPEAETWVARFIDGHVLFDWDPRAPKAFEWCRRDVEEAMTQQRLDETGRKATPVIQLLLGEIKLCFSRYEADFRSRLGDERFEELRKLVDSIAADPGRAAEIAQGAGRSDPLGRSTASPAPGGLQQQP